LKTILNRPIRSRESTTPTLENRQYFTVAVKRCIETDGTGILPNEATDIELSSVRRYFQKFARNPEFDPLENDSK
jgi:hypothetical protein